MTSRIRVVIDLDTNATESRPFDVEAFREGIANLAHDFYGTEGAELMGFDQGSATADTVTVDGRLYDPESQTLSAVAHRPEGWIVTVNPSEGAATPLRQSAFTVAELRDTLNGLAEEGYDPSAITIEARA